MPQMVVLKNISIHENTIYLNVTSFASLRVVFRKDMPVRISLHFGDHGFNNLLTNVK